MTGTASISATDTTEHRPTPATTTVTEHRPTPATTTVTEHRPTPATTTVTEHRPTPTTTTVTEPDIRPVTDDGDHDRFAHYTRRADANRAYVEGTPVRALCGKVWVPSRDPSRYPVCPECAKIRERLRKRAFN